MVNKNNKNNISKLILKKVLIEKILIEATLLIEFKDIMIKEKKSMFLNKLNVFFSKNLKNNKENTTITINVHKFIMVIL